MAGRSAASRMAGTQDPLAPNPYQLSVINGKTRSVLGIDPMANVAPQTAPPPVIGNDPTNNFLEATVPAPESDVELMDLFPNYAEEQDVVDKTKARISYIFSNISDRSALETIWNKNDQMFRCKPDASLDSKHRANEATGVFHISVNQLQSMAFKTFTDNSENYSYGFRGAIDDDVTNTIRAKNAEIMTLLFRKAQTNTQFKINLKRALHDCYKNGTCFVGIPWKKKVVDLVYRDKASGDRKTKAFVKNYLPGFEFISLDKVWVDENIDDIDGQPAVFIDSPITWDVLLRDSKNNNVKLFEPDGQEGLRNKFAKYIEHISSSDLSTPAQNRMDNADRDRQDRTSERYKHWFVWINLPINKDSKKWDEDGQEMRCRVRLIGSPENCEIIEVRENVFPGGIPILVAHQTEDDVGMYHISLGEKIQTYYDQICTSINQMIDNRSKNLRRPIIYDPLRVDIDKNDFGHSNAIPCQGDIRSAFMELQIADMTGTVMGSVQYFEQKIREIMNTTDAVMGVAMGGRTSASEFMSAKASATTPIYSDMASIEESLIGEYMRRFAQYIHTFMTLEDIVDQIGPVGAEFNFELADIYSVELKGVSQAMDRATDIQNLLQVFGLTQDSGAKAKILLRLSQAMGIENPSDFVIVPAKDQAIKAALWENNEILTYAQWDEPETGEMHDVHIPIHSQRMWQAQREEPTNANVAMMQQHIAKHQMMLRQEQAQSGQGSSLPLGQMATSEPSAAPVLGQESGQQLAAQMGNVNAGSPVPVQPPAPTG